MPLARLLERESAVPAVWGKDIVNGQTALWDPHGLQERRQHHGWPLHPLQNLADGESYIQFGSLITASPISRKYHF